ncbi:endothelin-converting enzyme homolog [Amphiura filiformis]|uniref:endothelin-converting enzyme homolog n=1 Tax=Amphiura filiformis TaxID=82378 RepID=UPI003B20DE4A
MYIILPAFHYYYYTGQSSSRDIVRIYYRYYFFFKYGNVQLLVKIAKYMELELYMMGRTDEMNAQLCIEEDIVYKKANYNKLYILCGVLWLVFTVVLIGVVIWYATSNKEDTVCKTKNCVITAGKLLQNMNTDADPCDNFYEFACGGWIKKTVLPEDKASYGVFTELDEDVQVVLKELFEREKANADIDAISKVKDFYAACLDLDTIETRDKDPLVKLLQELGGWPVLGNNEGGNWTEDTFDLELLLATFAGEYNMGVIFSTGVGPDDKDSSRYVIYLDQAGLGMGSRDYYLKDTNANYKKAYMDLMIKVTKMLGADETTATDDMNDVLEFETILANMTVPPEERRDSEKLYNPITLGSLSKEIPRINWARYFDIMMPEETKPIKTTELIINQSPVYVPNATRFTLEETPSRTVANYIIWRLVMTKVSSLSKRFRDAKQEYYKVLYGTTTVPPRWRDCVDDSNGVFGFATGRMYVEENFDAKSKANIESLIANLKTSFKDMLKYNDWMDEATKVVAREKCDAIGEKIGYPDWIKKDSKLNEYYDKLSVLEGKFFENIMNYNKWGAQDELLRLRTKVDKDEWFIGPAVVNAYYSPSHNQIVFPAGILRPPFYNPDSPWYLNYGGIGTVIGHEITHGFDDVGRQYDKNGNLKQWWSNGSISQFKDRAQCIVDQYSKYRMPENNKLLNGIQTQGENIADNGGLKESLKAYKDNEYSTIKLPGFEKYSPEQLFFLSFAQVWCRVARPESVDSSILSDPHSPGRYRVIGTAHNSVDFAKAYKCKANSNMNPPTKKKCMVW